MIAMGVLVHAALRSLPPAVIRREAERLLAHSLGRSREWVLAHPEAELSPEQQARFDNLVTRLALGEPLPYLLGQWEFFGLDFVVTPAVLIPRPETEVLVERAIRSQESGVGPLRIADVGTGSGIIAVTLAAKLPSAHITAVDISPAALAVARQNAERHGVAGRIAFVEGDLLSSFILHSSSFDLITANLPYIPSADLASLEVVKHEPLPALDGGPDGLGLIRRLLAEAPKVLAPGGRILLEIEYRQGARAAALAREAFPEAEVSTHKDLAALDRVIEIFT